MSNHARACALASAVVLASLATGVRADILTGVQPAALDQPQINFVIYVGANSSPQIGLTDDPLEILLGTPLPQIPYFNVTAYLDTGASGILISNQTALALNVTTATFSGLPVIYSDVGVAGNDNFNVSEPLRLALAPYLPGVDMDVFLDAAKTQPDLSPYTTLVRNGAPIRVQVGPYEPPVDNPSNDEIEQLLNLFSSEGSALDVIGMPALRGNVMVIDPRGVKDLGLLFTILANTLPGGDPTAGDITDIDLDTIGNAGVRTYLYKKSTAPAFNPASQTDPGIPTNIDRHVRLSYGSFDRFTQVTAGVNGSVLPGLPAPALDHNPFIGKNPIAALDPNIPAGDAPGITITRTVGNTVLPATGNWLLDTGAAASIVSESQALQLHVKYDRAGGHGPGAPSADPDVPGAEPLLIDSITGDTIPDQFTLVLGGIGGQTVLAGFWLDTLLLPTTEAALYQNDDFNIYFHHVPVLVGDITVVDPLDPNKKLTLDGIFGMNMLIGSLNFQTDLAGNITDLSDPSPNFFDWISIDLTLDNEGVLGLVYDTNTVTPAVVPEPASLGVLTAGTLALLLRRRAKRS